MDTKSNKRMRPMGQSIDGIAAHNTAKSMTTKQPKTKWQRRFVIGGAILLVLAVAGFAAWHAITNPAQVIRTDRYQVVYLVDDKVFFGKLQNTHGDFLTLENPYFTESAAPSTNDKTEVQPTNGNINLVKVSDRVYGPEESMAIRTDQVLFWQNLTTDSEIANAIKSQSE